MKLPSPLYTAVIGCAATVSETGVKVARPPLNVLVASELVPSLNVTVPVGVPPPCPATPTVAVKVTVWPNSEGLTEDARAVALLALFTVWVNVNEVLVVKLASPPYAAVIVCEATRSEGVANVAVPKLKVPVPIVVPASLNVTVPVGVPVPGDTALTVAVKVTDWPDTEGFADEATVVVLLA